MNKEDIKMLHKTCECGKTIISPTGSENQLKYNLKLHINSKDHKSTMKILEQIKAVKKGVELK